MRSCEADARRLVLQEWAEANELGALWSREDACWATHEARQPGQPPFRLARARLLAQRLGERDERFAEWLARDLWPTWMPVAALIGGGLLGLLSKQLGATPYLNLLHLPLWGLLLAQLLGYLLLLLLAWRGAGQLGRGLLAGWRWLWLPHRRRAGTRAAAAQAHWFDHSAPLQAARVTLLWHLLLLGLNGGLIAGLYLAGLGLEYAAGWQSTWLNADQVQAAADFLLAPASGLTGLQVPDVAPLRHGPGGVPDAPAAVWLHLMAATVALVALPRVLLVLAGARRCRRLASQLPWPSMRAARDLRLQLIDADGRLTQGLLAVDGEAMSSPEGDRLWVSRSASSAGEAGAPRPTHGWQRWGAVPAAPSWDLCVDAAQLPASAPGWPAQRRQLRALESLWPEAKQPVWRRLFEAWEAPLLHAEEEVQRQLAETLLDLTKLRVPLPDDAHPLSQLQRALRQRSAPLTEALHKRYGETGRAVAPLAFSNYLPHCVERPLPTGRNTVLGGMASGAAAGLGADAASGGLTLGAGTAIGAVAGALAAAGATRWLNHRQDRDEARVALDPDTGPALLAAALAGLWQREIHLDLPEGAVQAVAADLDWPAALGGPSPLKDLQALMGTLCTDLLLEADRRAGQAASTSSEPPLSIAPA